MRVTVYNDGQSYQSSYGWGHSDLTVIGRHGFDQA